MVCELCPGASLYNVFLLKRKKRRRNTTGYPPWNFTRKLWIKCISKKTSWKLVIVRRGLATAFTGLRFRRKAKKSLEKECARATAPFSPFNSGEKQLPIFVVTEEASDKRGGVNGNKTEGKGEEKWSIRNGQEFWLALPEDNQKILCESFWWGRGKLRSLRSNKGIKS